MSVEVKAQNTISMTSVKAIKDATDEANDLLDSMRQSAIDAGTTLNGIYQDAEDAKANALSAQQSADNALESANSAITQLSIIEDVAGTVDWITKHGTYVLTTDTTVQPNTVYFIYNSSTGDYEPIVSPDPTKNPHAEGWYTLDISDSQTEYIMAHLAVTARGLWVLPSGMASGTTPASGETQEDSDARQASNYKALLSSSGLLIYDGSGALVSTFGENIEFSSSRNQRIGGNDAYILFNHTTGELTIAGSKVRFAQVEALAEDLATAIEGDICYQYTTGGVTYDVWYDDDDDKYYYYNNGGVKTEVAYADLDKEDGVPITTRKGGLEDSVGNIQTSVSNLSSQVGGQAGEIASIEAQVSSNTATIATQGNSITTLQSGQATINNNISTINQQTIQISNKVQDLSQAVVIDPNEPSVTVKSGTGAVKITSQQVTIQGEGNTVSWADAESFNAKRLNSSEIRPRHMAFANNQVTLTGSLTIIGRSNGHMSLISID